MESFIIPQIDFIISQRMVVNMNSQALDVTLFYSQLLIHNIVGTRNFTVLKVVNWSEVSINNGMPLNLQWSVPLEVQQTNFNFKRFDKAKVSISSPSLSVAFLSKQLFYRQLIVITTVETRNHTFLKL